MGIGVGPRFASVVLLVLACGMSPDWAGAQDHAQGRVQDQAQAPVQDHPPAHDRDFRVEFRQSLTTMPDARSLTVRSTIYVPAYHSIRGGTGTATGLATLLRIDNTSATKPLVLERIDYFDTTGKLVQHYLDGPVALKPFGAVQIFIRSDDGRGGPAANFMVTWAGNAPMAEPLTETVMFGSVDGASYSFVSPGRAVRTVGKRHWFGFGLAR